MWPKYNTMKYPSFNLNEQNHKIESRIVVALERISAMV